MGSDYLSNYKIKRGIAIVVKVQCIFIDLWPNCMTRRITHKNSCHFIPLLNWLVGRTTNRKFEDAPYLTNSAAQKCYKSVSSIQAASMQHLCSIVAALKAARVLDFLL